MDQCLNDVWMDDGQVNSVVSLPIAMNILTKAK